MLFDATTTGGRQWKLQKFGLFRVLSESRKQLWNKTDDRSQQREMLEEDRSRHQTMMEDICREALAHASTKIARCVWSVCPLDEIKRATRPSDGVPYDAFFDTWDKVVVFPSSIPGLKDKFRIGNFAWRSQSGWTEDCSSQQAEQAQRILVHMAKHLRANSIQAHVVYVIGSDKGTFDLHFDDDDEQSSVKLPHVRQCDMALWIWTRSDDLVALFEGNHIKDQ
ncbi:hypothetical protein [Mollivirus kamchatka]|nr:hypothetical protein [Mollivirus kamchatka]